jgi:hypothetical protein
VLDLSNSRLKQFTSQQFAELIFDKHNHRRHDLSLSDAERDFSEDAVHEAYAEIAWHESDRPYYNVWPVACDIVPTVKLTLPIKQLSLPFPTMMFRFAKGHEPFGVETAMAFVLGSAVAAGSKEPGSAVKIEVRGYRANGGMHCMRLASHSPDQIIEDWLTEEMSRRDTGSAAAAAGVWLMRLLVFTCLLANGDDLITPVLLREDMSRLPTIDEDKLDTWLAERAAKARRQGNHGFDIGRELQAEKFRSPHFRQPHPCLFHTGPNGSIPVIKMRSGSKQIPRSFSRVPTGFLGKETPEEAAKALEPPPDAPQEVVYLLRDGERPYVKVGMTTRELKFRIAELSTSNCDLRLIGIIRTGNARRKESEIHRELSHLHRRGEFFWLTDDQCQELLQKHGGEWKGTNDLGTLPNGGTEDTEGSNGVEGHHEPT